MNTRFPCGCGPACCGCCAGVEPLTPQPTANRPGLSALAYRIGMHGAFFETMRARLTTHYLVDEKGTRVRPLADLRTHDRNDPSLALLDAWATVADVLTFYQERIANEGYLRTATEQRSVQELARLVGYAPRPGVAASTFLAYTIDEHTTQDVIIAKGSRAQSVPGPGELPQGFETSEDLLARAAWNQLNPRTTQPQRFDTVMEEGAIYLKGVSTLLKPGDPLLIVDQGPGRAADKEPDRELLRITSVDVEPEEDRTRISVVRWIPDKTDQDFLQSQVNDLVETLKRAPIRSAAAERATDLIKFRARADTSLQAFVQAVRVAVASMADQRRRPAKTVSAWLSDLKSALEDIAVVRADATDLARESALEPDAKANVFGVAVASLTKQPSRPLSNALQLQLSVKSGFGKSGDAGLQLMGAVSPNLRDAIGPVLTGTVKAPEAGLEVYAFRVRSGVFGRQAPKQQAVVTSPFPVSDEERASKTTTEVIGEWPIIELEHNEDRKPRWNIKAVHESAKLIHLETSYESILPGSWIIIDSSAVPVFKDEEVMVRPADGNIAKRLLVARVATAQAKVTRAEYGVTGETTRIESGDQWLAFNSPIVEKNGEFLFDGNREPAQDKAMIDRDFQVLRSTTVFAQSERLELAEVPINEALCEGCKQPIELDRLYQDLQPGRLVVLSGKRHGLGEGTVVTATEPLMISKVVHDLRAIGKGKASPSLESRSSPMPGDRIHTFVYFDKPLSYCYWRDTVRIYGNVVKATHGETRNESLGSGDGSMTLQNFVLKQPPLTHLAAPTAVGAQSTLQVFVNDLRWREETTFVDRAPTDCIFVTSTDVYGKTSVLFGNGREGARLPTGIENVTAVYRYGTGKPGNVGSGQITTLVSRPLGVKEVTNPLRASGGADRDSRDQTRCRAPIAVVALDRLVSTSDYADFARTFAGIAKADAVEISDGRRNVVHLTIAGCEDIPIDSDSELFINLRRALRDLGDPFQPIELVLRELLVLVVEARIRILSDYQWEPVVTQVRARLLETFSFERRELAQDVTRSEVLSAIQSVRGVAYVDLDCFGAIPTTIADADAQDGHRPMTPSETADAVAKLVLSDRVSANAARRDGDSIMPAQIAILLPDVPATLVLNQLK